MNLKNVVIVLDHPDESRNIGAVCRAMANNDIKTLRIVGSKENYDIEHIHVLAIHAGYIFDNAVFFETLTDAVKDCCISAGTTRRRGKKRGKLLLPEEFAKEAAKITDMGPGAEEIGTGAGNIDTGASGGKIALVFGNERTGLTDDQLDECTMGVTIPSSDEFGSLNLSHAVQIMCYQLFRQKRGEIRGYNPITLERLGSTVKTISTSLEQIGFFKLAGRDDMEMFWRDVLSRANLSEGEA
nr:RNA methyltransferase [Treponema sp.]